MPHITEAQRLNPPVRPRRRRGEEPRVLTPEQEAKRAEMIARRAQRDDDEDDDNTRRDRRPANPPMPVPTPPGGGPAGGPVTLPIMPPGQYYGRMVPQRPVWEMHASNSDAPVAYTPGYTPPVTPPVAPPGTPPSTPGITPGPTAVSSYVPPASGLAAPQASMRGILFGPPDPTSGQNGKPVTVGTYNRALWGKPYTPSADWTKPATAYSGVLMDNGGVVTVDPNSPFGENYTGMFSLGANDPYYSGSPQANEPVDLVGQDTGTTYASTGPDQAETITFTPSEPSGDATPWLIPSYAISTPKGAPKAPIAPPVEHMPYTGPSIQPTDSATTDSLMSILQANPQMKAEDAYNLTRLMQEGQAAILRGETTPQHVQEVLTRVSTGLTPHVPDMTNYRPVTPAEPAGSTWITPPKVGDAGLADSSNVTVSGGGRGTSVRATADPKFDQGPDATGRTLSQIRGTDYWNEAERAWYLMMIGQPYTGPAGGGAPSVPRFINPDGTPGRSVAEIRGTDYFSPEEREWYLAQIGKPPTPPTSTPAPSSGVTPPYTPGQTSGIVVPNYNAPGAPPTTIGQTAAEMIQKYFPPQAQNMAYHVVAGESGGGVNPSVISPPNTNGSRDYGIFQVNSIHFGMPVTTADGQRYILDAQNVLNPEVNAAAALQIYKNSISAGRDGWYPWSTTPKINQNGVR